MAPPFSPAIDRDLVVVVGSRRHNVPPEPAVAGSRSGRRRREHARAAARAAGQAGRRSARGARRRPTNGGACAKAGFGAVLAQGLKRFQDPGEGRDRGRSADLAALALRGPDALDIQAQVVRCRRSRSRRCAAIGRTSPASSSSAHPPAIDALACRARGGGRGRDRRRRLRGAAHRGRRAAPGLRHRRAHDRAGGVPRARRGVVHEGLFPRPGAGVPHRHPRPREPVAAPAPRRRRRSSAARRWSPTTRRSAPSRASAGNVALATIRSAVEPGSEVTGASGRRATSPRVEAVERLMLGSRERCFRRDARGVGREHRRRSGCRLPVGASTAAVPPIAAASSRTIARPRPVPTERPGVERDGVEAVEHVREVVGGMPGPSSATTIATCVGVAGARSTPRSRWWRTSGRSRRGSRRSGPAVRGRARPGRRGRACDVELDAELAGLRRERFGRVRARSRRRRTGAG